MVKQISPIFQALYPKETVNINASIDKTMITKQITVTIMVRVLGISEQLFRIAKSKNKLPNIIIKKAERNT